MTYYFANKERQDQLKLELDSWVGTPYKHRQMVKQKGIDCILFIYSSFLNIKVPSNSFKIPEYSSDFYLHNADELLSKEIKRRYKIEEIPNREEPMNGDILLYKFGQASAHAGIYLDGYVYHALKRMKLYKFLLKDNVNYKRLTFIYRVLE